MCWTINCIVNIFVLMVLPHGEYIQEKKLFFACVTPLNFYWNWNEQQQSQQQQLAAQTTTITNTTMSIHVQDADNDSEFEWKRETSKRKRQTQWIEFHGKTHTTDSGPIYIKRACLMTHRFSHTL